MISKLTKFAQMAALGLALTLTLSCSGGDDNGGGTSSDSGGEVSSSSGDNGGGGGSSSSVTGNGGGTACTAADNTDTQYCSNGTMKTYGSTPSIGGRTYKTVVIGEQTWMAENLNYDVPNNDTDVCYDNNPAKCTTYGRLYNWATAMDIEAKYNDEKWDGSTENHQGICPTGWHIPSWDDWTALMNVVGSNDGTKLKATNGWNTGSDYIAGTDDFGFSALPGGTYYGIFHYIGEQGIWWGASERNRDGAYRRYIFYNREDGNLNIGGNKSDLCSVRCVKD
jgi:uncharacterized protein (TIGR02145 family)